MTEKSKNENEIENEDELDGCDCEFTDKIHVTADKDLPVAEGGVEK